MIKIENIEVSGWEAAIRGMRNPMNSWDKSDSEFKGHYIDKPDLPYIGYNDLKLMRDLLMAGTDHSKFMRMINVTMDVTAPLYWWKEADTYKVGTVRNSCSTMHKIAAKEFEIDDFSHEHLLNENAIFFGKALERLNNARKKYLETKDKTYWWQLIQLLPSSYNQRATLQMNYAVLRNIYNSRKNHKLNEWCTFCHFIDTLPYSGLITDLGLMDNVRKQE